MTEYINREAVKAHLNRRLEDLRAEYGDYDHYTDGYEEAVCAVEDFPATDVAEVVRCSDCAYFGLNNKNVPYCFNRFGLDDPEPNGFCSYGESRGKYIEN